MLDRERVRVSTHLGLPHESVGVTVSQSLHDPLNSGSHFLRIRVTAIYNLHRKQGCPMSTSNVGCRTHTHHSVRKTSGITSSSTTVMFTTTAQPLEDETSPNKDFSPCLGASLKSSAPSGSWAACSFQVCPWGEDHVGTFTLLLIRWSRWRTNVLSNNPLSSSL